MTTFTEAATWDTTITQLDTSTQVLGGAGGPSNVPLQQLTNRTAYLKAEVEKRALAAHVHVIGEVTGLSDALASRASAVHVHAISSVEGLQDALDAKAPYAHVHTLTNVTGLQAALDGKAAASHTHGTASITGLQVALDGKAPASHAHAIGEVSALQAALDSKASSSHGHDVASITGMSAALAGKADNGHSHTIANITDLRSALDAKAAVSHGHTLAALGAAAASHTHTSAQISDLPQEYTIGHMGPLPAYQVIATIPFTRKVTIPHGFAGCIAVAYVGPASGKSVTIRASVINSTMTNSVLCGTWVFDGGEKVGTYIDPNNFPGNIVCNPGETLVFQVDETGGDTNLRGFGLTFQAVVG